MRIAKLTGWILFAWEWLATRIGPRRLVALLAVTAGLLTIRIGFVYEDHAQHLALLGYPGSNLHPGSWTGMFEFLDGIPAHTQPLIEKGTLPWWTDPLLRLTFLRPLSSITHAIDVRLWPNSTEAMHAVSALWYLAATFSAMRLVRTILPDAPKTVALIGIAFVLDTSHSGPLAWLTQRNSLISATFAFLAVAEHIRARRARKIPYVSGALLVLGLFSGEAALASAAWIFGYELFFEKTPWSSRISAFVPGAAAASVWASIYVAGNRGAFHSGTYAELRDPVMLVKRLFTHLPLFVGSDVGGPKPETVYMFDGAKLALVTLAFWAIVFIALWVVRGVLRESAEARLFAVGGVLGCVPACAGWPEARVMMIPGLGLIGVLVMAAVRSTDPRSAPGGWKTSLANAYLLLIVVQRFVLPLGTLPLAILAFGAYDLPVQAWESSLGAAPDLPTKHLVAVNGPNTDFLAFIDLVREEKKETHPLSLLALTDCSAPAEIERISPNALKVAPDGGFMNSSFEFQRSIAKAPMPVGTQVKLDHVTLEVSRATPEGRPLEVTARFAEPLESPIWRFVRVDGGTLATWTPPAIGEHVSMAGCY